VFAAIRRLGEARRSQQALRGGPPTEIVDVGDSRVLAWRRRHPRSGDLVGLANFAPTAVAVDADTVTGFGTFELVVGSDGPPDVYNGRLVLPGLAFAWYAEP
jgi:amylosucrase